jgi:CheY-like chemotaxis protein
MRRPLRILVVDEDAKAREQSENGLAALGLQVTGCPDEQQALSLCFAEPFDAVIVDLAVLGNGGSRLIRHLREHVAYKSLPIIGLAKPEAAAVPLGSGLDLVVEAAEDACTLSQAIHRLRQQRGFLASSEASPISRHWS